MTTLPPEDLLKRLEERLGPKGFTRDAGSMAPWLEDWRKRYRGAAAAMLSPETTEQVVDIVRLCAEARVPLVPQGGNSSMVAGATPAGRRARAAAVDAENEPHPFGLPRGEQRCLRGRGHPFPPARGGVGSGAALSAVAGGQGQRDHRRADFHQCRGDAGASLRPDAKPRSGNRGGAPRRSLFTNLAALKKDNRGYDLKQLLIGAEGRSASSPPRTSS
jgi:FAD/FMN-containing dehydrogenase